MQSLQTDTWGTEFYVVSVVTCLIDARTHARTHTHAHTHIHTPVSVRLYQQTHARFDGWPAVRLARRANDAKT